MKRAGTREAAGWLAAALLAVIATAQVASTPRGSVLFSDGDALIVALLGRSLTEGQPQDWAMSSVLFVPETAVFLPVWWTVTALGLGLSTALFTCAVVNILALYGALRWAAGRPGVGRSPVFWSLAATAVFGALVVTEVSPSRDALELASLLLGTTYYSATIIAVLFTVGLVARGIDRPRRGALIAAVLIAAFSSFTNPLYLAWATVPIAVLLAVTALRPALRRAAVQWLVSLGAGSVLGLLGRIPLGDLIVKSGAEYAQPHLWPRSVDYYGALLGARWSTVGGVIASAIVLVLLVIGVRRTLRATDRGERLVAASSWAIPLTVAIGAIGLGTHAARYLEPVVFLPLLALVAQPAPRALTQTSRERALRVSAIVGALLLVAGAAVSVPRAVAVTQSADADARCVVDWIEDSGRTGGGQFWTVRLPKALLADPAQLVQLDHTGSAYLWLVNRTDYDVGDVTFLVESAADPAWSFATDLTTTVDCGRYTIRDLAPLTMPIGAPRV